LIERTFDYRIVKKLLGCNPWITSKIIYLLDGDNLLSFNKESDYLCFHINMKSKKGQEAIRSALSAFEWVFKNTNYQKIVAHSPVTNRPANFMATQCMTFTGKDDNYHHYEVLNV